VDKLIKNITGKKCEDGSTEIEIEFKNGQSKEEAQEIIKFFKAVCGNKKE